MDSVEVIGTSTHRPPPSPTSIPMRKSSALNTPPHSPPSQDSGSAQTDEQPPPPRQRTPVHTVIDFDGNVTSVRTHKLLGGRTSRSCVSFTMHCVVLSVTAVLGATMAIFTALSPSLGGPTSPAFSVWVGVFTFAVGAFIPAPKIKKPRPSNASGAGGGN